MMFIKEKEMVIEPHRKNVFFWFTDKKGCYPTEDGFWKKMDCYYACRKTEAQLRCVVTMQLICAFVLHM